MKTLKFIEVKSEIGAGTRGASMGVDAIKIEFILNNIKTFLRKIKGLFY